MSHQGSFSSQPAGGESQVLMLDGDFDRSNSAPFEQALDDALNADRPQLIVDLRGVSFLDSTMLRALIRGLGDAVARGGHLALIRPNATVWRLFVLTGLSQTLPAFGRLDEALASFRLSRVGAPDTDAQSE
jgi:anti-anti-sigma factor